MSEKRKRGRPKLNKPYRYKKMIRVSDEAFKVLASKTKFNESLGKSLDRILGIES